MTPIQLARTSKTSVHTIRYYERIGLLEAARNPANGYHEFEAHHAELLRFIKRCRTIGLSLGEIRTCVKASSRLAARCPEVAAIVRRALDRIDADIAELLAFRERMNAFTRSARRRAGAAPRGADVRRLVLSLDP
jgi:DNA-binding transcriptional MerR regulator